MDYKGKYFSVVGDSISTLLGYIPDGYALYYDENNMKLAGIESWEDTWWGQIISRLGGKLLKNDSWSGSTVSYHAEFTPGSFAHLDSRMSRLGDGDIKPDVVMIYMGVNDWASGTPVETAEGMEERASFTGSYGIMLDLIKEHYPDARVWCISPAVSTLRGDPNWEFPYKLGGIHLREYAEAIKAVAEDKGCIFIDANKNGTPLDALDGIHPDKTGMKTLADEILRRIPD
ncbi:MAG: SGNH/GDSL hydrolase family protein [Clostridia bacterium]|nr:SGNH/GDSL hydrolase family protein [Clostridia bacterium]